MNHRQMLAGLLLALASAAPASAQIAGPVYVFTNGTVIDANEVNANFATIYANACNRTGCTLTGPLLFSADNSWDIGALGTTRPRDLNLGRNALVGGTLAVTGASTFTGAATFNGGIAGGGLTITSTTAPQFITRYDASNRASLSISSTGLATFDAVGVGAGFVFSDDAAFSGNITMAGTTLALSSVNPIVKWIETDAAANAGRYRMIANGGALVLQTCTDAEVCNSAFLITNVGGVAAGVDFSIPVRAAAGTAALPGFSFMGYPGTGFYNAAANTLNVATNGASRWAFDASGHFVPATDGTYQIGSTSAGVANIYASEGTNNAPAYRFKAHTDSGFYWDTVAPGLALTLNGSNTWTFAAAQTTFGNTLSTSATVSGAFRTGGVTFANIATQPFGTTNGAFFYCSDCTITNPCAGGGTGALAKRLNSVWVCN